MSEAAIHDPLHAVVTRVVVETLGLDARSARELSPHAALVGGGLALNELDVLEVAARLEEQFEVSFNDGPASGAALRSIASLSSFIHEHAPEKVVARIVASEARIRRE